MPDGERNNLDGTARLNPGTSFKLANWNIAGAKYLTIPDPIKRDKFKEQLQRALNSLANNHKPDVVTIQEIVEYEDPGDKDKRNCVIEAPPNYILFPNILIDTDRYSHQGKWDKIREALGWDKNSYIGQGNAILVHEDLARYMFPVMVLPKANVTNREWCRSVIKHYQDPADPKDDCTETCADEKGLDSPCYLTNRKLIEHVVLQQAMYFGNRDTEPRTASVCHFCIPLPGLNGATYPLDVFVVNLHLTTLTLEREGIPHIDNLASERRLNQLDTVFEGVVSPYHEWRKSNYLVRNKVQSPVEEAETLFRQSPVWLIAGDYNFTPASAEYRRVQSMNFVDMLPNHDFATKATWHGSRPTLTVDYVFAGPLFESINQRSILESRVQNRVMDEINDTGDGRKTAISDHYPILVQLPYDCVEKHHAEAAEEKARECRRAGGNTSRH